MTELLTIGHSNVPVQRIIELLRQHGIAVVVDVRSVPYSRRNPQFRREAFRRTLQVAGLTYVYLGQALGGRPADPACYEGGELLYDRVMAQPGYQKGIDLLLEIAAKQRTAILCAEEDPQHCHRQHLITQTLLERGVTVWHIRGDGQLQQAGRDEPEPRQLALF